MKGKQTKEIAFAGLMISLAMILSYVESLIPIVIAVPGVKLGLANVTVMVVLYVIGMREAVIVCLLRILLVALTYGNFASMMYSMAGGLLSIAAMILVKKWDVLSIKGVSIIGGVAHNIGQILMAILIVENHRLLYYLPVLLMAGTVTGAAIGLLAQGITKRAIKVMK